MTITLPNNEDQHRPIHRVLVSKKFYGGNWQALPIAPRYDIGQKNHGYEVEQYSRAALPDLGKAVFFFRFGVINGIMYGINSAGGAADWQGYFVRIQVCDGPTTSQLKNGILNLTLNWRTVFVGTVELQDDALMPGGQYPIGIRKYHCVDLLGYADRWMLGHHGYDGAVCRGHPGYNMMLSDGSLAGDMGAQDTQFTSDQTVLAPSHTQRGKGALWKDMYAINHALMVGRSEGDPQFYINADDGLLQGAQFWQVLETDSALRFVREILRRQRGRGVAYLSWADDTSNPLADMTLNLTVVPQFASDIVYTDPITKSVVTISGASSAGTIWPLVDLQGDHRNVETTFRLGSRYFNTYGYVEVMSEPIEVLSTLSYADQSLEQRWTGSPTSVTLDPALENVYQLHSTPRDWDITGGDGTGTASGQPLDYRCDDNGNVIAGGAGDTSAIVSRFNLQVLRDTPYPSPGDAAIGALRGEPRAYINTTGDKWVDVKVEVGANLAVRDDGILLKCAEDDGDTTRVISLKSAPMLAADWDFTKLAFTIALKLPHRVRLAAGDPAAPRKKTIIIRGLRLWLADPGAIVGLDFSSGDDVAGHTALGAAGADIGPCIALKDDRDKLAALAALAITWYAVPRITASWQLRACGFLGYFLDINGAQQLYPQLGYVVKQMSAGGGLYDINTPITMMHFDVEENKTTWTTDWSDLDLG